MSADDAAISQDAQVGADSSLDVDSSLDAGRGMDGGPSAPDGPTFDGGQPDGGVDGGEMDATISGPDAGLLPIVSCGEAKETRRGVSYCETEIARLTVAFVPLLDGRRPTHLAAYFHGDGAGDWPSIQPYGDWARDNDVLFISVLAPNEDDFGPRWWLRPTDESTAALVELLEEFFTTYSLPRDEVLFTGVSGGSQYLTNNFVHRAGDQFQGVIVMNCGGSRPSGPPFWDFDDETLRGRFSLHFNYSTEDFLRAGIEAADTYWSEQNFRVTRRITEGTGHCMGIDQHQEAIGLWEAALAR